MFSSRTILIILMSPLGVLSGPPCWRYDEERKFAALHCPTEEVLIPNENIQDYINGASDREDILQNLIGKQYGFIQPWTGHGIQALQFSLNFMCVNKQLTHKYCPGDLEHTISLEEHHCGVLYTCFQGQGKSGPCLSKECEIRIETGSYGGRYLTLSKVYLNANVAGKIYITFDTNGRQLLRNLQGWDAPGSTTISIPNDAAQPRLVIAYVDTERSQDLTKCLALGHPLTAPRKCGTGYANITAPRYYAPTITTRTRTQAEGSRFNHDPLIWPVVVVVVLLVVASVILITLLWRKGLLPKCPSGSSSNNRAASNDNTEPLGASVNTPVTHLNMDSLTQPGNNDVYAIPASRRNTDNDRGAHHIGAVPRLQQETTPGKGTTCVGATSIALGSDVEYMNVPVSGEGTGATAGISHDSDSGDNGGTYYNLPLPVPALPARDY